MIRMQEHRTSAELNAASWAAITAILVAMLFPNPNTRAAAFVLLILFLLTALREVILIRMATHRVGRKEESGKGDGGERKKAHAIDVDEQETDKERSA